MSRIKLKRNSALVINFMKIFALMVAICVVASAFMLGISKRNFEMKLKLDSSNAISRLTNVADIAFRNIEYASSKLCADAYVQAYMFYPTAIQLYSNISDIMSNTLQLYKGMNRHIESIYVYSEVSDSIFTTFGEFDASAFSDKDALSLIDGLPIGSYAFIREKENVYPNVITFIYKANSDDNFGAVIINVTTESIVSYIVDMCDISGSFYMLDKEGTILYTKKEDMINNRLSSYPILRNVSLTDSPTLIRTDDGVIGGVMSDSSFFDWSYVHLSLLEDYRNQLKANNLVLIFPLIMIFISGFLVSLSITVYTYRPIEQILKIAQDPQKYFTSGKSKSENDEVSIVAAKILMLISSNEKLNESLNNKISLLNSAQINMLQAQINPHFLYNALHILNGCIVLECGYNSKSSEMVVCLSQFLRYALKTDKILISIKQELNYLKKYVRLLEYRYTDQFSVVYDIDDNILDKNILKMSFQPLVENCIEHGFADKCSGGIITISAKKTDLGYKISVSDNGVGITNFDIASLFDTDERNITFNSDHIGLRSVIYRYKIVFSNNAEIKIESTPNVGTTITIEIISE